MNAAWRTLVAVATATGPIVLGACWSLGTDVPDIFGARTDGSGADVASVDARSDATSTDASTAFCQGRDASVCADFEGEKIDAGVTETGEENGGTLARVARPEGEGFALLAKSNGNGDGALAALTWRSAGRAKSAHVELDMRIESLPQGGSATVLARFIDYLPNDGYATIDLWAYADKLVLAQQIEPQPPTPAGSSTETSVTTGKWRHYVMDFQFEGEPHVTVRIDGASALEETLTQIPPADSQTTFEIGVRIGPNAPAGQEGTVYFDNVVADIVR